MSARGGLRAGSALQVSGLAVAVVAGIVAARRHRAGARSPSRSSSM